MVQSKREFAAPPQPSLMRRPVRDAGAGLRHAIPADGLMQSGRSLELAPADVHISFPT